MLTIKIQILNLRLRDIMVAHPCNIKRKNKKMDTINTDF